MNRVSSTSKPSQAIAEARCLATGTSARAIAFFSYSVSAYAGLGVNETTANDAAITRARTGFIIPSHA